MALFKHEGYKDWTVDLGDPNIKAEMGDQLNVTSSELGAAINMENLADRLFSRVLKNRSRAHQALLEKVPGVKE